MSDIETVAKARELVNAATKGPWYPHATDDGLFMNARYVGLRGGDLCHDGSNGMAADWPEQEPSDTVIAITLLQYPRLADADGYDENAEFIAASRELVPQLCDIIDRLNRERTAEREQITGLQHSVEQLLAAAKATPNDAYRDVKTIAHRMREVLRVPSNCGDPVHFAASLRERLDKLAEENKRLTKERDEARTELAKALRPVAVIDVWKYYTDDE